jgi:hypothetical protein
MDGAERILVVILSSALAVFLLLAIAATILVIQILNHIKRVAERAEEIANKAEAVTEFFQKTAGPMAIGRFLTNIADAVFQKRSEKSKQSKEG